MDFSPSSFCPTAPPDRSSSRPPPSVLCPSLDVFSFDVDSRFLTSPISAEDAAIMRLATHANSTSSFTTEFDGLANHDRFGGEAIAASVDRSSINAVHGEDSPVLVRYHRVCRLRIHPTVSVLYCYQCVLRRVACVVAFHHQRSSGSVGMRF